MSIKIENVRPLKLLARHCSRTECIACVIRSTFCDNTPRVSIDDALAILERIQEQSAIGKEVRE